MNQVIDIDARLNYLWNRLNNLSKQEWEEFYLIIYHSLQKLNHENRKKIADLELELEDYINDFFVTKIMKAPRNQREDLTEGHIKGFFYLFLNTKLKRERKHKDSRVYLDDDGADNNNTKHSAKISEIKDEKEFYFSPDVLEETLLYHNFTRQQLTESANQFFTELQQWQQQVLSLYLCSNSAMPLAQFQEQYAVTATYYKVRQLGIVQTIAALPHDYPNTKIGRWITQTLGLDLCRDNYEMLGIALKILCLVALQVLDD